MISKNIVQQPKSVVEVQVSVPWDDLAPKWEQTLQRLSQDVELPGFRKGAAPANMVEQHLGNKLQEEFLKDVMPPFLVEALQGSNIVPIDYPKYQLTSFIKGGELKFSASVTQRPQIITGDYKGIKVARPALKTVTDEEVDKLVGELFKRWQLKQGQSSVVSPLRAASEASHQSSDNQKAVNQGAGGSLNFNQAQAPAPVAQVEEPSDDFARAVGATSLMDLKTKIRQDLESEAKYNNELDFEEAILQEVEKITTVEVPEILVADELNRMLLSLQRTITERGMLLDEYLKGQNQTVEQLKEKWREQAEKNVKMELGLSEIAKSEGVTISDQELQAEIDKIQDNRVKSQFTQEEPKMHLRHALRQTKTLTLLKSLVGQG